MTLPDITGSSYNGCGVAKRGETKVKRGLWAVFLLRCPITVQLLLCPINVANPVVLGSGKCENLKGVYSYAKVVQRWLLCLCECARACSVGVSSCVYVRASAAQVSYFMRFSVCVIMCSALQP